MSQSQPNKADKPIHCIACGKIIGQGYIVAGSIKLLCKCGVKTKIEAEIKPEGRCDAVPRFIGSVAIPDSFLKKSVFK